MTTYKGWTKKGSLEEFKNGAHLEDEEREDLGIPGCRRLQQEREWGIGDLEWVDIEGWRKKINLP